MAGPLPRGAHVSRDDVDATVLERRARYEALARRRPFSGHTDVDLLHATMHAEPDPLPADLPQELRTIVEKALEKDPAERYQSMRDLTVDLRRVVRRTSAPSAPRRSIDGHAIHVNILMDRDADHWARDIAALKAQVGVCDTSASITPTGALSGGFTWTCATGRVHGSVLLARTPAPRIQNLSLIRATP